MPYTINDIPVRKVRKALVESRQMVANPLAHPLPAVVLQLFSEAITKDSRFAIALKNKQKYNFRFIELPDFVRQLVRDSVLHDLEKGVYRSYAACADAYGVSHAVITNWHQEAEAGKVELLKRGRPQGVRNQGTEITQTGKVVSSSVKVNTVRLVRRYFTIG